MDKSSWMKPWKNVREQVESERREEVSRKEAIMSQMSRGRSDGWQSVSEEGGKWVKGSKWSRSIG